MVYREVDAPGVRDVCYDPAWPEDLRWIKGAVKLRGVPRWLVLVDGRIVSNFVGLDGYGKMPPRLDAILAKIDRAD